jgi:CubicO group peptidase (beta-lactamase class C family)
MRPLIVLGFCTSLLAAPPAVVDPGKAGLDGERLARIPARMREFVDSARVAGVVTLVARHGQVAALDAVGYTDVEGKQALRTDNIFQIHSMTKPVVAFAVMMLAEEGRLSVSDPVEQHLPEFRGQRVVVERDGDRVVLGKPRRPITIRDLLTHTSGMPLNPPEGIKELHGALHKTLAETVLILSQQPLLFEPGTAWQYSNTGIAAAARIIEVISGMPFETFLAKRIFEPLGMVDTYVYPPKEKFHRMPTAYIQVDGKLVKYTADPLGEGKMKFREGAKYPLPEGALYSTAADLFRFYQLMLNRGELEGVRLLSPASVEIMTALHTGDLEARPGIGYGLGWQVVKDSAGQGGFASIGTYGHGGRYGTYCFLDPAKDLIGIFLIHREGDGVERTAFQQIVYSALTD